MLERFHKPLATIITVAGIAGNISPDVSSAHQTTEQKTAITLQDAINLYYPALKKEKKFRVNSFRTSRGNAVNIINTSSGTIAPQNASLAFSFYEGLSTFTASNGFSGYKDPVSAGPNPNLYTSFTFVTDANVQQPPWSKYNAGGITSRNYSPGVNLTHVVFGQAPQSESISYTTTKAYTNMRITTEICQNSIVATPLNPNDKNDQQEALNFGEFLCDSLGRAFDFRQRNQLYPAYYKSVHGYGFYLPDGRKIPYWELSQQQYAQIPQGNSIIK